MKHSKEEIKEKKYDELSDWIINLDSQPDEDHLMYFYHDHFEYSTDVTWDEFVERANKEIEYLVEEGYWEEAE